MSKFFSRKLFVAIGGAVLGGLVYFGYATPEGIGADYEAVVAIVERVSGVAVIVADLVAYLLAQGGVDKAEAANGK